ncbi:aminopeptidase [Candidatus Woesebacteria bacterium]|nr:aminopeptidase [Candidatus Woesebacteria bacterium]
MHTTLYQPSQKILKKYAEVLVNFALGTKEGILKGEVVECIVPDVAKPLALELHNAILKAGGHVLMRIIPTGFEKSFFELANQEQLTFFPARHLKTRADLINHSIGIIADTDPFDLTDIEPEKIMSSRNARQKYREWLVSKENKGKFTWTLALWGVAAKAEIVGLSIEEYWDQIIQACFLDKADPIAEWRAVNTLQEELKKKLNSLYAQSLHIVGEHADLTVKLGSERLWNGGSGRNIPSFELFTSPDWRGTEGWIEFNEPLYRYGTLIEGVRLEFRNGLVAKAHARKGNKILQEMLKTKNADKIGEYSLTDKRMSRITHTMAETLFDENIGGPFGNTHLAIGMAYKDCYRGNPARVKPEQWAAMGYNESAEHTDIVSTTDRTVTATLPDGSEKVIYAQGMFTL